jgi:hypothetical protein
VLSPIVITMLSISICDMSKMHSPINIYKTTDIVGSNEDIVREYNQKIIESMIDGENDLD